jgi:hypothetical protein
MTDEGYDSNSWIEEPGASTGDRRANDPSAPGYAPERDRVFRSQFQRVNGFADRGGDAIELDRENEWLNVRTRRGQWQSVRVATRAAFDAARQGSVEPFPETG